jgi:uncharacterized protein YciU (UPF0263 family)
MTLYDLKVAVDAAIERADENGEPTNEVLVTLQMDRQGTSAICSSDDVQLHYDGNLDVSGCVISAWRQAL